MGMLFTIFPLWNLVREYLANSQILEKREREFNAIPFFQ